MMVVGNMSSQRLVLDDDNGRCTFTSSLVDGAPVSGFCFASNDVLSHRLDTIGAGVRILNWEDECPEWMGLSMLQLPSADISANFPLAHVLVMPVVAFKPCHGRLSFKETKGL